MNRLKVNSTVKLRDNRNGVKTNFMKVVSTIVAVLFVFFANPATADAALQERVLIISQSGDQALVSGTLTTYNKPYDVVTVNMNGLVTPLPALSSGTTGLYKLIVVTTLPWGFNTTSLQPVMAYLSSFNAKLVKLNDFADSSLGIAYATGLGYDNGQTMSFAQTSFAVNANLQPTLTLSTSGLYHYPVKITNTAIATPVMYYDAIASGPNFQTVSVALIQNPSGGTASFQQLSFYIPFATWSGTSKTLNQVWYSWGMGVSLAPVDTPVSVNQKVLVVTK
ncbi:hypothetical protein HDU76_005449, partial [Blyttiomyces sp. JEL0837]